MRSATLTEFKRHLRPGRVYRRGEIRPWSASVDRHLKTLVGSGGLKKLRYGLYYCPKRRAFGEVPATERELLRALLRTDRFVVSSPTLYNLLGLGTTQIYNKRVVYNQKRHGMFDFGGRVFQFERRMYVPRRLTAEFLLVDLVKRIEQLSDPAICSVHVVGCDVLPNLVKIEIRILTKDEVPHAFLRRC